MLSPPPIGGLCRSWIAWSDTQIDSAGSNCLYGTTSFLQYCISTTGRKRLFPHTSPHFTQRITTSKLSCIVHGVSTTTRWTTEIDPSPLPSAITQRESHDQDGFRSPRRSRKIREIALRYSSIRHASFILPIALFTAATTFLLISTLNDSSMSASDEALLAVDDCIKSMSEMSWPTSAVGKDTLQKMKSDWHPRPDRTPFSLTSRDEAIKLLQNPSSEMSKLLAELGWSAPETPSATQPMPLTRDHPSQPLFDLESLDALSGMDNLDRKCFRHELHTMTDATALADWSSWLQADTSESLFWAQGENPEGWFQ
jgi:hypothetical protein